MCPWCNLVHLQHHFCIMCSLCMAIASRELTLNQEVITEKCLHRYIQKGVVTHAPTWLHTDGLIRNLPKPVKECKYIVIIKSKKKRTPNNHHLTGKGRWRLDGLNVKSICDEHAAPVVALDIASLPCSQVQTTTTACIDSKKIPHHY